MKKAAIALLIASTLGLTACQKQEVETAEADTVVAEGEAQKDAYALGSYVGGIIQEKLLEQEKYDLNLDRELVVKGFVDALQEKSQMEQAEIKTITSAIEAKLKTAKAAMSAIVAKENLANGAAYLAENEKRERVTQTESGLQYEVITTGEGVSPKATDTVKVHYKGTLIDGTEFDSSYSRGEPTVFPLSRVIKGWTEGIQLMKVGSKYKFYIPSSLAYGTRTTGKITSNSALIFEVELLEIISTSEEK